MGLGDIFSPSTTPTTTTSNVQLPAWLNTAYQDLYNRSNVLSQEAYPLFPGPRIAPFTEDQTGAFDLARSNVGLGSPALTQAVQSATTSTQTPDLAGIQQYMDPFNQLVTADIVRELDRRFQTQLKDVGVDAAMAGGFGGSRFGVLESELGRNQERLIADVLAQRFSDSYNQGLGQFNIQQQMSQQGANILGQLGIAQNAMGEADVQQLLGIGTLQQQLGQTSLDTAYSDFARQQQYPYQQAGFVSDILGGIPSTQSTISTSEIAGPSVGQQLFGAGLGALGIYGAFFQ